MSGTDERPTNHWSESGRAAPFGNADAQDRPLLSVSSFGQEMKRITIIMALVAAGCASPPQSFITRNLIEEGIIQTTPSRDLLLDSAGNPIVTVPTDQVMSKWQIHPDAPLGKVARFTGCFRENERIELWTEHGIYLVSAPCYGGRRLPWFGSTDIEYRVSPAREVTRDRLPWLIAKDDAEAVDHILADLQGRKNLGFVNLYFDFTPTNTWSDAESAIDASLPRLDGIRGLWIGEDTTNRVTLHLHDVWKKEWRGPNQASEVTARKFVEPQR